MEPTQADDPAADIATDMTAPGEGGNPALVPLDSAAPPRRTARLTGGGAHRVAADHATSGRPQARPRSGLVRAVCLSAGLSALCLRSFVHSGYILQVDAVFGPVAPHLHWNFGLPVSTLQWLLTHMAGGSAAGRVLFFGALFVSAFGPMLLLADRQWTAQCVAGLLGALNPWTAERLSEGQFGVVAAAGCLFLVVAAWERLRKDPRLSRAVLLAVAGAAAVACNAAFLGIVVVLVTCAVVSARAWKDRDWWRWTGVAGCVFVVFVLYGVIPFFLDAGTDSATALGHVDRSQLIFFSASRNARYGLFPNLLGLYGDWAERLGRFQVPNHGVAWWPISTTVLVALALLGGWRRRDRAWLLVSGGLGIAFSASTATAPGLRAATWLTSHLPLAGVYREPEKWSALWLVALAVLAAEGTVPGYFRRRGHLDAARRPASGATGATGATAALVMAAAVCFPAGLAQVHDLSPQLRPAGYPADWTRAAAYLRTQVAAHERVLVLPWHLYEGLDFADHRVVANPARDVFDRRLIFPDDPEIPGQPMQSGSDRVLSQLARSRVDSSCLLAGALRQRRVHWVVVERAPGGNDDADRLLACGFRAVEGRVPTVVLHAPG